MCKELLIPMVIETFDRLSLGLNSLDGELDYYIKIISTYEDRSRYIFVILGFRKIIANDDIDR